MDGIKYLADKKNDKTPSTVLNGQQRFGKMELLCGVDAILSAWSMKCVEQEEEEEWGEEGKMEEEEEEEKEEQEEEKGN